jgi:hypothetical protein
LAVSDISGSRKRVVEHGETRGQHASDTAFTPTNSDSARRSLDSCLPVTEEMEKVDRMAAKSTVAGWDRVASSPMPNWWLSRTSKVVSAFVHTEESMTVEHTDKCAPSPPSPLATGLWLTVPAAEGGEGNIGGQGDSSVGGVGQVALDPLGSRVRGREPNDRLEEQLVRSGAIGRGCEHR